MGSNYYYYPNIGGNSYGARINIPNAPTAFPSLCSVRPEVKKIHRNFLRNIKIYFNTNGDVGVEASGGSKGSKEIFVPVHDTAMVDMNGDGLPDIVHSPAVGQWFWWQNLGNGQFADRASIAGAPSDIQLIDLGTRFVDMDGDGLLDIVHMSLTLLDGTYLTSNWNVRWWRNLGPNQSQSNNPLTFNSIPTVTNGLVFHHSYPDGSKACSAVLFCYYDLLDRHIHSSISMVDMNGDGLPDIVWIAANTPDFLTARVYYLPNMGAAGFGSRVALTLSGGGGLNLPNPLYNIAAFLSQKNHLVDMNGDGRPDILAGQAGGYYYYPLQANQTYGSAVYLGASPGVDLTRENFVKLTETNGDGFPDILWGRAGNYISYSLNMSDSHQNLETVRNLLG